MSQNKEKNNAKSKQYLIITVIVILLAVLAILSMYLMKNKAKEEENTLAYTDLIKEMSYGNVEKIEMKTGSTTVKVKIMMKKKKHQ